MTYFEKAQQIESTASHSNSAMPMIYLGISRIFYLQGQFEKSRRMVNLAEMVVVRQVGVDKGFMVQ